MSDNTEIEWADSTWNPVTGCTEVTPGCDHCYAKTFAERFRGTPGHYFENGFDVQLRPDKLDQPLRWKRPRRIFVNSMSDLFHDQVPDDYIARVWAVMALASQHTFQVLTKRHGRMRSLLESDEFRMKIEVAVECRDLLEATWRPLPTFSEILDDHFMPLLDHHWPLPNVWLGVSAEDQKRAELRIPALLDTPAAVRFVSAEPLLGPVDMARYLPGDCPLCADDITDPPCGAIHARMAMDNSAAGIDWVIVGGESGHGARPMHPDWARSLRDQCEAAGTAFLFKQWGEWTAFSPPANSWTPQAYVNRANGESLDEAAAIADGGSFTGIWRVGKKAAGRELDGRTWDQYPEVPRPIQEAI